MSTASRGPPPRSQAGAGACWGQAASSGRRRRCCDGKGKPAHGLGPGCGELESRWASDLAEVLWRTSRTESGRLRGVTTDRWISVIGDVIGAVGVLVSIAIARWPRKFLAPGSASPQPPQPAPVSVPVPQSPSRPAPPQVIIVRERKSDSNGSDELVFFLMIGGLVFVVAAAAAVAFVQLEKSAANIAAVIAVCASTIALLVLLGEARRRVLQSSTLGLVAWLFFIDAAVASLPSWFRHPWFGQGRFDDLPKYIGSPLVFKWSVFTTHVKEALKAYGDALIFHALAQASGLASLIVIALALVFVLVKRWWKRGRVLTVGDDGGIGVAGGFGVVLATVLAVSLASGAFASAWLRVTSKDSWTAGKPVSASSTGKAPPIALAVSKTGALSLQIAMCGASRAIRLDVVGAMPVGHATRPRLTPSVLVQPLRLQSHAKNVTVTITTTRTFPVKILFTVLPKRGGFSPAEVGITQAEFDGSGFACSR